MTTVESSGRSFACTAAPHPWQHGVGVHIEVSAEGEHVGSVHVLCSRDSSEYNALALLAPSDLCALALARFAAGELPVTLQNVLSWQEAISATGHAPVSPLISSFSRSEPSRSDISVQTVEPARAIPSHDRDVGHSPP